MIYSNKQILHLKTKNMKTEKQPSVLVIEDNPIMSALLEGWIKKIEPTAEVILADNYRSALGMLQNGDYSLITLDGNLSEGLPLHGRNILASMKEDQRKKTIVCSSEKKFLEEAKKQGIYTFDKKGDFYDFQEVFLKII